MSRGLGALSLIPSCKAQIMSVDIEELIINKKLSVI
jgi:hypothetical protein